MVPWAHRVYIPNSISIGSAVLAQLVVASNRHTHSDHATYVTVDIVNINLFI